MTHIDLCKIITVFTLPFALSIFAKDAPVPDRNTIVISDAHIVARVTGKPLPDEGFPGPNNTAEQYDVGD